VRGRRLAPPPCAERQDPERVEPDREGVRPAARCPPSLNSLGLKQSFVVTLGEDIRTVVLAAFEATWENAEPL
jgi:hypothetical protein